MKKLVLVLAFLFSFLTFPKIASAQGEYICGWNPARGCGVQSGGDRCDQGYMPGNRCSTLSNATECNTSFSCIDDPNEDPAANTVQAVSCDGGKGLDTAIGCIPIDDPNAFLGFILKWAIGVGGGIAFLLIVYSSFMIMSSSGNPDRLKAGQELLTSALMGVVLLVFSVFILRVIGVDILGIPGFGANEVPIRR